MGVTQLILTLKTGPDGLRKIGHNSRWRGACDAERGGPVCWEQVKALCRNSLSNQRVDALLRIFLAVSMSGSSSRKINLIVPYPLVIESSRP
jgi:hypothetical protein